MARGEELTDEQRDVIAPPIPEPQRRGDGRCRRPEVGRLFARIRHFRRVAMRFDRHE